MRPRISVQIICGNGMIGRIGACWCPAFRLWKGGGAPPVCSLRLKRFSNSPKTGHQLLRSNRTSARAASKWYRCLVDLSVHRIVACRLNLDGAMIPPKSFLGNREILCSRRFPPSFSRLPIDSGQATQPHHARRRWTPRSSKGNWNSFVVTARFRIHLRRGVNCCGTSGQRPRTSQPRASEE